MQKYNIHTQKTVKVPKAYKNIVFGYDTDYENRHKQDGFYDIIMPTLTKFQRIDTNLTNGIIDTENGTFTYGVIDIPEPTAEELQQQEIENTKIKYENHKSNGWEAYQNFRANIVKNIDEGVLTELQAFAIEEILSVSYDKISATGDWKTAYYKLSQVVIPSGYEFVEEYYNTAMQEIATYIQQNYDTE